MHVRRDWTVEFEWDEGKRRQISRQRGFDILDAALIFNSPVLTRVDDRGDYGELREVSTGIVDGDCFIVVHTERNGVVRLITAWKGGRDDREQYQASLARRHQADER